MKLFLITLLLNCIALTASEWEANWIHGIENCASKNYIEAEKRFNCAICQLEKEGNIIHPHVYVDRARLFSLLERDVEALDDLNIAIESPLLQGEDRLRAVVTRLITFYRLGMETEAVEELEVFKSIYPIPKFEVYKEVVIVRNVPDCKCSHELLKLFVGGAFCESLDDVKIMNGICIAKKNLPSVNVT